MKYLIIMWILCLFITGRHFYLHWPQPVARKVADPPNCTVTITQGRNSTVGGGHGGVIAITAGSGGNSSVVTASRVHWGKKLPNKTCSANDTFLVSQTSPFGDEKSDPNATLYYCEDDKWKPSKRVK